MVGLKIVKCRDTKGKVPRCIHALPPAQRGVLSSNDMAVLGYIKCACDKHNYLANADRVGCDYRAEDKQ